MSVDPPQWCVCAQFDVGPFLGTSLTLTKEWIGIPVARQ